MKVERKEALKVAIKIKRALRPYGKVKLTGSIRRGKKQIGDIDVMGSNVAMSDVLLEMGERVRGGKGGKRIAVMIDGFKIDFWWIPEESWAAGMMTSTGSAEENIMLRGIAKKQGKLLNQYGVWHKGKNLAKWKTERQIYALLGVDYRKPSERKGWKR